jgi:hypothetical protein
VAAISTTALLVAFVSFGTMVRSGAAVDTNAPVLASLAMSPSSVNTSTGPAVVTITARLTDERSPSIGGTAPLSRVVLTGPGGQQQVTAYLSQAQRVSGAPTDGIYTSTLKIPWHAAPGSWNASAILVDISGNTRALSTANLASSGFPSAVTETGPGDTKPPQLVAIGIAPASVDTSQQPADITVSVHAVDDLSGVSDGVATAASQVVLQGPSGAHHARATLSVDHRTAGNALDATFVVVVTLPRWSEQGQWTVESVTLVDQVGNQQTLTAPGVTFMQVGLGDTSMPQFRAFSLSTTNVDVRTAPATIVMRSEIVDDISGAADGLIDSATSVVFESPSGRQRLTVPFGAAQRIAGTGIDGDYSMSASVPAHAEPGVWSMTDAWPTDAAGNVGHLDAGDWAGKAFPGSFTVVSDTSPDTGPTVPTIPDSTPASTTGSVFTTTSTTVDPNGSTTTVVGATTTTDPFATTTTLPDGSSTTIPDDTTSTTVPDDSSTTMPDETTDESTSTLPGATTTTTVGSSPTTTTVPEHTDSSGPPPTRRASGYWFATAAGRVVGFGTAASSGTTTANLGFDQAVGIANTPSGKGYWLATARGDVLAFGDARSFGSMQGRSLTKPIVGIAATPDGGGYWLVATDGGIFGFGDAHFYGSTGAIVLNQPIVGMTATPSGHGYWFVAADGGLFSYGDARFFGSMGATRLNQPVVGMTASPKGLGYWMVARDGGIFSFGDTRFFGSTGAIRLNQPIVGMSASPSGRGYWFVAGDGGVFSFGDARFFGSIADASASGAGFGFAPVVGMAVRAS